MSIPAVREDGSVPERVVSRKGFPKMHLNIGKEMGLNPSRDAPFPVTGDLSSAVGGRDSASD